MKLTKYIETLKIHPDFRDAFVYHRDLPARPAIYGPELSFHGDVLKTMKHVRIDRLYSHQVKAIEHLRHGANVLVATPTASGKSLIYNLTVLEEILKNRDARALYVFPLKALEQDQLKNLSVWLKGIKETDVSAEIYDGDTTPYKRKKSGRTCPRFFLPIQTCSIEPSWPIIKTGKNFLKISRSWS